MMSEALTKRFEMRLSEEHTTRLDFLCSNMGYKHKADLIRYLINKEHNRLTMYEGVKDAGK